MVSTRRTLLKDDAAWIMPPFPNWYRGRDRILTFIADPILAARAAGLAVRHVPLRANGQPAMAIYHRPVGKQTYHAMGLQVLTVDEAVWRVAEVITFHMPALFARFGLPTELSDKRSSRS